MTLLEDVAGIFQTARTKAARTYADAVLGGDVKPAVLADAMRELDVSPDVLAQDVRDMADLRDAQAVQQSPDELDAEASAAAQRKAERITTAMLGRERQRVILAEFRDITAREQALAAEQVADDKEQARAEQAAKDLAGRIASLRSNLARRVLR